MRSRRPHFSRFDNRMARYRSWGFSGEPIRKACTIRAVGGRWGLRVQVSRTVSIGEPDPELLKAHQHAALIHATAMYFAIQLVRGIS
ncbi:MAG: hypothetical protein U0903_22445 [Planctomycetales bacterium]